MILIANEKGLNEGLDWRLKVEKAAQANESFKE